MLKAFVIVQTFLTEHPESFLNADIRHVHISGEGLPSLTHLWYLQGFPASEEKDQERCAAKRKCIFHLVKLWAKETHCKFTQTALFPDGTHLLLHPTYLPKTEMHQ